MLDSTSLPFIKTRVIKMNLITLGQWLARAFARYCPTNHARFLGKNRFRGDPGLAGLFPLQKPVRLHFRPNSFRAHFADAVAKGQGQQPSFINHTLSLEQMIDGKLCVAAILIFNRFGVLLLGHYADRTCLLLGQLAFPKLDELRIGD